MKSSPRGRALVITMTGNREGWQADIKNLHKLFLYLDVYPDYLFDLKGKVKYYSCYFTNGKLTSI